VDGAEGSDGSDWDTLDRVRAARGESPAAFDERCIPAICVAPPSNTGGILSRRALFARRLTRLGATPDFHHGPLGTVGRVRVGLVVRFCAALCMVGAAAACGQLGGDTARAEDGNFYQGKTVSIIVGSGAGGGFDTTARLVARHITRHIPGAPTVIVVNMPGGGGLVAANHVFSAASKDGTVVGLFHEAQMMNQLTGGEGVNFDLRAFNWLGSSYDDPNVCIVRTDAPVTAFEDLVGREMPIAVGGTGPGSNTYDAPRVLAAATGANLRAVAGYPTTNDVRIGVERGEIRSASGPWLADGTPACSSRTGRSGTRICWMCRWRWSLPRTRTAGRCCGWWTRLAPWPSRLRCHRMWLLIASRSCARRCTPPTVIQRLSRKPAP
jgi:hypothetical protein